MITVRPHALRPLAIATAIAAVVAASSVIAPPAQARVFVGIGIPLFAPFYYPPPVYYPPPPVYYPPPPVVYAPPPPAFSPAPPQPGGQSCYAGPYVCPMDRPAGSGGACYCPGNNGQRVWGRAN